MKTPAGAATKWLHEHVAHEGAECLIWPFFRDPNGYGRVGSGSWDGKRTILWTHRAMCILAHGEPPSPDHEASHSCGKGHEGCVNPKHLEWKTRTENQLDRRFHGTKAKGHRGGHRKLTPENVAEIRALRGLKTQREIAAQFGVTDATIRDIYSGKSWTNPDLVFNVAEVLEIRKLADYITREEIARMFEANVGVISRIVAGRTYAHVPADAAVA